MTSPGQSAAGAEPFVTTGVAAGPGGVMTVEVGVVTGDLTLRTTWDGAQALLDVQYDGADEWYTVEGSPVPAPSAAAAEAAHHAIVEAVRRGGAATAADLGG
ncbi:hypothetical protein ACIRVF_39305 [Kitasatospora sp. NPDC101157]|uniref:hypothetical protein n=1 Tax=Kitasatospora sp. NPDC101157 TaxID=3364098 RepID=UPI00380FE715